MTKSIALTRREQVLFDRLLVLGQWASQRLLPVDAIEIIGFGSFFRGKPNPKDVDLLIRHTRSNSQDFTRFQQLLDIVRRDMKYRERFDTPLAALLDRFNREPATLLPGCEDLLVEERSLFGRWIEGISWNMLSPGTIAGQVALEGPVYFTERLVKRHLPNMNIAFFLGPDEEWNEMGLRSTFVVPIWSRQQRDIRGNLEYALSPERHAAEHRTRAFRL